jgi:lipid II:glycine glycyltransferase (peptidoglycan interpeptide bridge formation enzyme)
MAGPNPHLLQSYRWGELQARFGWEPHRHLVREAGLELPLTVLVTPTLVPGTRYGYVPKGPATDEPHMEGALVACANVARELDLAFIEVEPELPSGWVPPAPWEPAPATQPPQTSIIDLGRPDDELLASFKPKTRYNVRLAERKGVTVTRSDDIAAFAELSRVTSTRHAIHLADEPYYRALLDLLAPVDGCRLYLARAGAECLAGIMVVRFAGRATYLFGASGERGRELMPAYALHWHAMRELRADGDTEYDMWGVPPPGSPGHAWAGLHQFKSGWQGRYVAFAGAFALPLNPRAMRLHRRLSRIRGYLRKVRPRL